MEILYPAPRTARPAGASKVNVRMQSMRNKSAVKWATDEAWRRALYACLLLALVSCAAPPLPVNNESLKGEYYIRYAIRGENAGAYTKGHRSNHLADPVFRSPGKKASIPFYSHSWVDISFHGIVYRMFYQDQPFRTDPAGIKAFIHKHFTTTPKELALDALEPNVRNQIEHGVAAVGMSKEEVLLALGYPGHIDSYKQAAYLTRGEILESSVWIYRYNEIVWPVYHQYTFDEDGNLAARIPP